MTENGLADMLRAVLENDNALVVVVEAELSNDDDRTALLLVVNA